MVPEVSSFSLKILQIHNHQCLSFWDQGSSLLICWPKIKETICQIKISKARGSKKMCSEMFFSWVNLIVRKMFLIKVELKVNRNKCFCSYCIERSMSIFLTRLFSKSGNTSKISPSLQMRHQESSFRHKFSSGRLHVEVSELEGTWWCG